MLDIWLGSEATSGLNRNYIIMVLYMLKTIMRVSNFFGMAEYNRLDEGCSENLTTSLILCFYAIFTIY